MPKSEPGPFPPPPWGMIADDLTGACDAAAPFATHGFRTVVWLAEFTGTPAGDASGATAASLADLTVLPTFSRNDSVEQARRKVEAACRRLADVGVHLIYKKIDSTLKGNLAAEIDEALASGGFSAAIVSPAFPAMGRSVVNGLLLVNGENTGLHVPSLLETVPAARAADAASEQDLRELAETALAGGGKILCVGSGGLAAHLAAALAERFPKARPGGPGEVHDTVGDTVGPTAPGKPGPALFLIGSDQPATLGQVDYLVRSRPARAFQLGEVDRAVALQVFRQGRHLVVIADIIEANEAAAARLLAWAPEHLASGLVLSGGDTAAWACRAGAVEAIEVRGEVLPGIPWGEAMTASGQRLRLVTKAGGFGGREALAAAADFLMGEDEQHAP